jgi:hypothetical protein
MDHMNLRLDMRILFTTLWKVPVLTRADNAYAPGGDGRQQA